MNAPKPDYAALMKKVVSGQVKATELSAEALEGIAEITGMDFVGTLVKIRFGEIKVDDLSEAETERMTGIMGIDRAALQARFGRIEERERRAPGAGDLAPKFELEGLDSNGKRTGERYAPLRRPEKPVALIFGSYT